MYNNIFILSKILSNMATKKKKAGRPTDPDKKFTEYIYLRPSEKKKILKKHKTLTDAVVQVILPQCA